MIDIRKIAIVFVIAVLYAIFVNALIGAVYPSPEYEDFCSERYYAEKPRVAPSEITSCPSYDAPSQEDLDSCSKDKGYPEYNYDSDGCITSYKECNYCKKEFNVASKKFNLIYFILSSILAVVVIVIGLFLPTKNPLNEWIGTGLILGGLFALFFGTIIYYQHMDRFVKPVIILLELILVIYLTYRTLKK